MAHEEVRQAYQMLGKEASAYDGMITCSTAFGQAVCRLVWAMGKAENARYIERALAGIPEGFSGRLLEVPVGTGVLTLRLPNLRADVTCWITRGDDGHRAETANCSG